MRTAINKLMINWIFGKVSTLEILGYVVVGLVTAFIGVAIISAILQLPTVF